MKASANIRLSEYWLSDAPPVTTTRGAGKAWLRPYPCVALEHPPRPRKHTVRATRSVSRSWAVACGRGGGLAGRRFSVPNCWSDRRPGSL